MNNEHRYNYQGHEFTVRQNYDDVRYNRNNSRQKSKRKGTANLIKAGVGALALFTALGFSTKFSEIDREMSQEEGVTVTQNYSPSGGIDTVYHGEKQHNAIDVLERMIEEIKNKTGIIENENVDGFDQSISRG